MEYNNNMKLNIWKIYQELKEENASLKRQIKEFERFYQEDVTKMATEAGQKIEAWENFFSDSLEDVQSVLDMLDALMKHRQMMADDADVQHLYKIIVILRDILTEYTNAKDRKPEDSVVAAVAGK
jgi:hypothetical protein